MHPICFACMCKSTPCAMCSENEFDIEDLDLDSVIDATINKDISYKENNTLNGSNLDLNKSGKINISCIF